MFACMYILYTRGQLIISLTDYQIQYSPFSDYQNLCFVNLFANKMNFFFFFEVHSLKSLEVQVHLGQVHLHFAS